LPDSAIIESLSLFGRYFHLFRKKLDAFGRLAKPK